MELTIVEIVKQLREEHYCYMDEIQAKELSSIMDRNGKDYRLVVDGNNSHIIYVDSLLHHDYTHAEPIKEKELQDAESYEEEMKMNNIDKLEISEQPKLKVLELFAGTRSIGKAFESQGHEVFSVEYDKQHENIDCYMDIEELTVDYILKNFGRPDIIWASPDCTTYSIAGISHHRTKESNGNLKPKSEYAIKCDRVNQNMLKLIMLLKPKYYFIENPRGGMRKMWFMQHLPMYTVTYCQYGDFRMKPTDIWTNHPNPKFKPMCKNGMPCHTSAPRGSSTGTQGIKGKVDRSKIPTDLCDHIVKISEEE